MAHFEKVESINTSRVVRWIFVYLLLLAIPTVILVLLLPKHVAVVLCAAVILFFAVPSFLAGYAWVLEDMTDEARDSLRVIPWLMVIFLLADLVKLILHLAMGRNVAQEVGDIGIGIVMILSVIVPFFIGRVLVRRELLSGHR